MKAMIAFFGQVPTAADAIRANLKTPMPKSFIDYGVAGFNGLGDFYAGDARQAFADVDDKGLQQQFADASAKAAKAMHDLGARLASQKASANPDFALGPERFSKMLSATEGLDIPLDQLEALGTDAHAKNPAAMKQDMRPTPPGRTLHPPP